MTQLRDCHIIRTQESPTVICETKAKMLLSSKWVHATRYYRNAVLRGFTCSIIHKDHNLTWLHRQLALMGQEVDAAIYDLRRCEQTHDEFFETHLSSTYIKLKELTKLLTHFMAATTPVTSHVFRWAIAHWFSVCRYFLFRAWLTRAPRQRQFYGIVWDTPSLEHLLRVAWLTNPGCDESDFGSMRSRRLLDDITIGKLSHLCHPRVSQTNYNKLCLACASLPKTSRCRYGNQGYHGFGEIVQLEASTNSEKFVVAHFKEQMNALLERHASQLMDPVERLGCDRQTDTCFALGGMVSLFLILCLLLLLHAVFEMLPPGWIRPRLAIDAHERPESAVTKTIICYSLLAPFCVLLNFELRLFLGQIFLRNISLLTKIKKLLFSRDHRGNAFTNRILIEITMSWRTFEHFELRLTKLYTELIQTLRCDGLPV